MRIVTYHRVADPRSTPDLDPSIVSATPTGFRRQMDHLRHRYVPVSMQQVIDACLEGGTLPPRAVHVTFDDAYRDVAEHAWPVLRELEIPFTIFVPSAYPGEPGRWFWWDRLHKAQRRLGDAAARRVVQEAAHDLGVPGADGLKDASCDVRRFLRGLPHDHTEQVVDRVLERAGLDPRANGPEGRVLGWDELRQLQGEGVSFGAHTRSHAALPLLDDERVACEIRESLRAVSLRLEMPRNVLAYPYGLADQRVAALAAREGCALAFTTEDGLNRPGATDPHRLRRTNITLRTTPRLFRLRMLPWFATVDRWRHRRARVGGTA